MHQFSATLLPCRKREFFIHTLLVRNHLIIEKI